MVKIGNFELKEDLYYWPKALTWAKIEPDGNVRVGITDVTAETIRGMVNEVQPKPLGTTVKQGTSFVALRLTKLRYDLESPISGEMVKVNPEVISTPRLIKTDPYGSWIALMKPTNLEDDLKNLLKGSDPKAVDWYTKEINTRIKKV